MTDDKAEPNQIKYTGEVVDGQLILTSVEYPPQFVGEDGQVVMTCETLELTPERLTNAITLDDEYPMATSPFDEEPRQFVSWDHVVMHQTVGGKGVVGRLTEKK